MSFDRRERLRDGFAAVLGRRLAGWSVAAFLSLAVGLAARLVAS